MDDTIEFYITQTRTMYPEQGGVEIHLYGRTTDGECEHIRVQGFEPYFYVPVEECTKLEPKDHSDLRRVETTTLDGTNTTEEAAAQRSFPTIVDADEMEITESLKGRDLARVVATHPGGVPKLKDQYEKTYEADVIFTNRLRIDQEIYTGVRVPQRTVTPDEVEAVEIEDADVRYCYFDIEVDDCGSMPVQGGEIIHTDSEIVTITAYDSFDDEYIGFINLGERELREVLPEVVESGEPPGCLDRIKYEYDERSMLKTFFEYVQDRDPDVLVAWNNLGFDAPYLIERTNAIGLDPGEMARGPQAKAGVRYNEPSISGRVVYDLMKAWKRMQYTEVSARLNNAAQMELDDPDIVHGESIYELWQDDAASLLEYNGDDVELMVRINEAAGVLDDREELKDTVGVDYEQTYEANDFIGMLTRRKLREWSVAGPTKTPPSNDGDDDYEGALTLPAFEGVKHNVTSIDLSSLYPMSMRMLNSSPETLVDVVDNPQQYVQEHDGVRAAPNGAVFRDDEDGLFRALVDEALELTQQAGRRRDSFPAGSEMWEYWNQTREARKRIRNGLYGVLGWVWFFLYDEPVAEAVTTIGQAVIGHTRDWVNENTLGEVVYGDTDSCYIAWPDGWSISDCLERTDEVAEKLNNEIYPEYAQEWGIPADECDWVMEMEDASEAMFQAGKKKRYAKRVVWKEGMDFDAHLDDASIDIKGFEYKRSDTAELTAKLQKKVLEYIVNGLDNSAIRQVVFEAAEEIERRYPDWDLIGIPGGIGQPLDEYDSDTAQVTAAKASNKLLDLGVGQGDKPKRVYLEEKDINNSDETVRTEVIAFQNGSDLDPIENQLYVDVPRMQEVLIRKPIGRILEPVGISVDAAIRGRKQEAITDFV